MRRRGVRVELVGGPHCGAVVDAVPARQVTVWVSGTPRALGSHYVVTHTNAPALRTDVAYAYDNGRGRYLFCGAYDDDGATA